MMADDIAARVEAALARLVAEDRLITFTAVADDASVARATLYRNPALRALVDEHRVHQIDTRDRLPAHPAGGRRCARDGPGGTPASTRTQAGHELRLKGSTRAAAASVRISRSKLR